MHMCKWLGIGLVFCAACGVDKPAIRLGTFGGWPGYEPFYLARDIGYLNAKELRLVDYNSSTPLQNDFAQGVIEAATLTLDETVRLAARRSDFRIVLLLDESRGADAIIAQPAFHSLSMLKGKRIGLETSGVGTFLLGRALEKSSMAPGDIQTVSLRFDEQERAFTQGEVDAIASFEPLKSRLTSSGARVVFDSSEIPGEILDVLVVREDVLADRRSEIREIISVWFRALAHMRNHEEQSRARVARAASECQRKTWRPCGAACRWEIKQ
jgi:NitT/TauT family transport system substrate-binding protein